jgi:dGTPase
MQLLGLEQTHFFRNRLTHSLEVSQISRGIASKLQLDTTLVAEASSLAHDLGNPPFGHHGERVLNNLASDIGGYEGNAQTLRILMRLEKKHHDYRGLNLTLRTLLGVIRYPWLKEDVDREPGRKAKFVYKNDYEEINAKLKEKGCHIAVRSIYMQVMDLADEIAYAAHDLEDCLSIGYFTIEELLHEFRMHDEFREAHS